MNFWMILFFSLTTVEVWFLSSLTSLIFRKCHNSILVLFLYFVFYKNENVKIKFRFSEEAAKNWKSSPEHFSLSLCRKESNQRQQCYDDFQCTPAPTANTSSVDLIWKTASNKIRKTQNEHTKSFVKIWTVSNREFNANFFEFILLAFCSRNYQN